MKKKYSAIFITVRSSSSRLPKKCYLEIDGKKTIEYVIERVKRATGYDLVVLCTTENKQDDKLIEIAKEHNIEWFRGSSEDKLERWLGAVKKFNVDFFATVDGDDLFYSPELLEIARKQYLENTNSVGMIKWDESQIYAGSFTFLIDTKCLKEVCKAKNEKDTEMMWVFFEKNENIVVENLIEEKIPESYKRTYIRATLDYQEDFIFFKTVIEKCNNLNINVVQLDNVADIINEEYKINFHKSLDWKKNQEKKIRSMKNV